MFASRIGLERLSDINNSEKTQSRLKIMNVDTREPDTLSRVGYMV